MGFLRRHEGARSVRCVCFERHRAPRTRFRVRPRRFEMHLTVTGPRSFRNSMIRGSRSIFTLHAQKLYASIVIMPRSTNSHSPYTPTRPNISPVVMNQVRRTLEREFAIMEMAEEFRRLQYLNINTFTRPTQALANSFARNVINGSRGNHAALESALNALPRVRRIGSGSPRAHAAATTIQARVRGAAGRKRAKARGTKLVVGPNGNVMVAVPNKRR